MTNDDINTFIDNCNLSNCEEIIPNKAYFCKATNFLTYPYIEMIILIKGGVKVGGINLSDEPDIHIYMKEEYRGQHIMSEFLKTGTLKKIWPHVTSTRLCKVTKREIYDERKHLAALCNLTIKNTEEIESHLSFIEQQRQLHQTSV